MARLISVSFNGWITFGAGAINAGFVGVFLLGILMGLSPNGRFSSGSFGTNGVRFFLSGLAGGAGGGGSGASIGGCTAGLPRALSLIHISEPTRPY